MRLHLLALPHTQLTKDYSWCAFTSKVRKMASMMYSIGYDVRLYGVGANEAHCTEYIQLFDTDWQKEHFGKYDWDRDTFNEFDPNLSFWKEFNAKAIEEIRARMEPFDILGMSMGYSHKPVADALPELFPVETGIGYSGVWAPYRVFESQAWQHYLAAKEPIDDIRYFDEVIPNYFEEEDFPLGSGAGDYYLFVGRMIRRKGLQIAVEVANQLGVKLVLAGQGLTQTGPNTYRGIDVELQSDNIEYVGRVGPVERAKLMGNAKALFAPSIYLEPFCGVAVEAMMTGTPVITTDWGAFRETVVPGLTGFRCKTLKEFIDATYDLKYLTREDIRAYAVNKYSTDMVRYEYDDYFKRLQTLRGKGWYEL